MNKIFKQIMFLVASVMLVLSFVSTASAALTPVLSLSATGNGDTVQVGVNGDPNVSVILYYTKTNVGAQISVIGNTNASGYFSTNLSSATYGIASNTAVHVSTGGITGPVSSTASWPTVNTTTTSSITLSQTGLVLAVGQTNNITATNGTTGTLYVSNNSNPAVANVNINSNTITITGNTTGSTVVTICSVGNTTNCPSVYVTVQNSGTTPLTFSQNNITLASGQNVPITISGGTGVYTVLNNSSNGLVTASISGSVITLSTNTTTGSGSITVCSTNMSSCGIINVTLSNTSSSLVSFSQSSPTVSVGQSITVSVYGGTGSTYYVSSNSNPSVVQANLSGSILTLYGITSGSTTLNVCSSVGGCNTLIVTVSYVSTGGTIALSQTSLTITTGQTLSITISGGTAPYSLLVASNSTYQASINGNILSVTGITGGSAQINVCSAAGGCTGLSLQVNGNQTYTTTTGTSFLTLSQSSPTLSVGQSSSVIVSGGMNNGFNVAYNSNSSIVSPSITGNTITLYGAKNGYAVLVVCDSSNNCVPLPVVVGASNTYTNTYTTTTTTTTGLPSGCSTNSGYSLTTGQSCGNGTAVTGALPSGCVTNSGFSITTGQLCGNGTPVTTTTVTPALGYQFTLFLSEGASGNEVLELQKRLKELGYFNTTPNGNFGPMTAAAVAAFQRAYGVSAVGYVGPSTRALLNAR